MNFGNEVWEQKILLRVRTVEKTNLNCILEIVIAGPEHSSENLRNSNESESVFGEDEEENTRESVKNVKKRKLQPVWLTAYGTGKDRDCTSFS